MLLLLFTSQWYSSAAIGLIKAEHFSNAIVTVSDVATAAVTVGDRNKEDIAIGTVGDEA